MKLCKVDKDGVFLEDVIVNEHPKITIEEEVDGETILKEVKDPKYINITPKGFYSPRYNFETGSWVEGLSQAEIDEINNTPKPKTELQKMQEVVDQLLLDSLEV